MLLDHDLRTQINSETDSKTIRKHAIKQGMIKMRISGARKVAMGWTTIEEVMKVVPVDEE
jgi:general secretion pathway protein E